MNTELSTPNVLTSEKTFNPEWIYHHLNELELRNDLSAFVVDLDDIAIAIKIDIKRVRRLRDFIKNHSDDFILGVDYQSRERGTVAGGSNKIIYELTIDAAKTFLILYGTENARKFRRFFITQERKYRQQNFRNRLELARLQKVIEEKDEIIAERYRVNAENRDKFYEFVGNLQAKIEDLEIDAAMYREFVNNMNDPVCRYDSRKIFKATGYYCSSKFHREVIIADFIEHRDYEVISRTKNGIPPWHILLTYKTALSILLSVRSKKGMQLGYVPENMRWLVYPTKGDYNNQNSRLARKVDY